ncbi:GroES-like protein [Powellomyces hirtus]|nr:GroES-like protein [Powellomyces hirtus]
MDHALRTIMLPTPTPESDEVLVRTLWLGVSPLTQWQVDFHLTVDENALPFVPNGNLVGQIVAIGSGVRKELQVGATVFSCTFGNTEQQPAQEFVIVPQHRLALVPVAVKPEHAASDAAAVPEGFVTAWHSFTNDLGLNLSTDPAGPSTPERPDIPILVWGGGTSVGHYAIQVLKWAKYTNILTTASPKHHDRLRKFGATHVFDYNSPQLATDVAKATGNTSPELVLDCVGDESGSLTPISRLVRPGATVAFLLPVRAGGYGSTSEVAMETSVSFPEGVTVRGVRTFLYDKDPGPVHDCLQPEVMPRLLMEGHIVPTKIRIIEGKTPASRMNKALEELRKGSVSGEKLVVSMAVW